MLKRLDRFRWSLSMESKSSLTQTLRLKQIRLVHSYMTTPGQKIRCVVPGEKRSRGGVFLELDFL